MINPRVALKLCRVCGDKASAFNFNGLTCECCKIFFRRNALTPKKLICRKEGACEIDFTTRKCCPACRLEKCFSIGMKFKDKTIEKMAKNNYIDMNKSSKNNSPKSQGRDENLRQILENGQNSLVQDKFVCFSPQTKIKLNQVELDQYELLHLGEVQKAISVFGNENSLPMAVTAKSVIEAFKLPCNYAKRIVQFCKSISAFRKLCQEDQFRIQKPFYFEICAIRFAYYYDLELDGIPMYANENCNQVALASFQLFVQFANRELAIRSKQFMHYLRVKMENDPIIRDLLIAQFLFKPREDVTCTEFLRYRYYVYCRLLRRYFEFKYNCETQGKQKYESLLF